MAPCAWTRLSASSSSIRCWSSSRATSSWASRGRCCVALVVAAALAAARAHHLPRRRERRPGARPRRARRRCGSALLAVLAVLPAPAVADPEGGRPAAELPRRPDRRLAQHDDRRSRRPAAQPSSCSSSSAAGQPAAQRAVAAVRPALLPLLLVRRPRSRSAADLKYDGHGDAARPGARARARRAGRPAARRPRDGHRRRRHLGRVARRAARQPEGAVDSGLHRRRRPGALRARHPDHARRNAARRRSRAPRSSSTSSSRRPATPAQTVPLNVEDDGRIVSTQDVTLPPDGESATVRVHFTATDAGAAAVPLPRSPPQADEQVTQNNARDALVEVARPPRDGALLRRRAARSRRSSSGARSKTTRTCRSSILQRTAENKYLRARRRQPRRAGRRLSEDARGAVRLPRASFSAASKPRRSRPTSCACSPTSSASAAAAC